MDRESLQRNLASFLGVHYPAWSQVVEAVRALAWLALPPDPAPAPAPAEQGERLDGELRTTAAGIRAILAVADPEEREAAMLRFVAAEIRMAVATAVGRAAKAVRPKFPEAARIIRELKSHRSPDRAPEPAPVAAPDARHGESLERLLNRLRDLLGTAHSESLERLPNRLRDLLGTVDADLMAVQRHAMTAVREAEALGQAVRVLHRRADESANGDGDVAACLRFAADEIESLIRHRSPGPG